MITFLLRRLLILLPTFFGITIFAFAILHLVPGDPVEVMAGERGFTDEEYAQMLAELGLDKPIVEQYWDYMSGILRGDLGTSLVTKERVWDTFTDLFPATAELALCALLFALVIGLPAGILAAVRRGTAFDYTAMMTALTGYSIPVFWWGLLLILLFSVNLGWLPVSGRLSPIMFVDQVTGFMLIDTLLSDEPGAFLSAVRHLVLPTIVLGTIPLAVTARMTRSAMLEVLQEDYVRTARAKGVSRMRTVSVHALRNALIPVVTVIGLQLGHLLSGAILTETVFSWPGIGKWLIDAIYRRDYPIIQAGILIIATLMMLVNISVDVANALLNPRIRHGR